MLAVAVRRQSPLSKGVSSNQGNMTRGSFSGEYANLFFFVGLNAAKLSIA